MVEPRPNFWPETVLHLKLEFRHLHSRLRPPLHGLAVLVPSTLALVSPSLHRDAFEMDRITANTVVHVQFPPIVPSRDHFTN